jgi:hypothetical protein
MVKPVRVCTCYRYKSLQGIKLKFECNNMKVELLNHKRNPVCNTTILPLPTLQILSSIHCLQG